MTIRREESPGPSKDLWSDMLPPQHRAGLMDWLRAWRAVIRHPDKRIPSPPIPPEGVPIPDYLDLHCPECDYNLTGLRQWRCPECGERFSPHLAFTRRLMRSPEFALRYRYNPADIRLILWSALFLIASIAMALLFVRSGIAALLGVILAGVFTVLIVPNLFLMFWQTGAGWPRFLFWLTLLFLLAELVFILLL